MKMRLIIPAVIFLAACGGGGGGGGNGGDGNGDGNNDDTSEARWDTPVQISPVGVPAASHVSLAMDPDGNTMAIWSQFVYGNEYPYEKHQVATRYFMPGHGWGGVEAIHGADGHYIDRPRLGFDGQGRAVAVWFQSMFSPDRGQIRVNRYLPETGWGEAETLQEFPLSVIVSSEPKLAVAPTGNAVTAWVDYETKTLWTSLFTPENSWSEPESVQDSYVVNPSGVDVAIDDSGNAVIVWADSGTIWTDILAMRHTSGTGWSEPVPLDTVNSPGDPKVGLDSAGNGIALWQTSDDGDTKIYFNRFTPDAGWSEQQLLATGHSSELVVRPGGDAHAVWAIVSGSLRSSIYSSASGWSSPESIPSSTGGSDKSIAFNDFGEGLVVWRKNYEIMASYYEMGDGWMEAARLYELPNINTFQKPVVVIDNSKKAVAAWYRFQEYSNQQIWASDYPE